MFCDRMDGKTGGLGRMLHCVDRHSGKELWNNPVAEDATGEFSINRDEVFIADTAKGVSCLKFTAGKEPLWSVDVGGVSGALGRRRIRWQWSPSRWKDPAMLIVLDGVTGQMLWRQKLVEAPRTGAVIFRDRVWVGTGSGVSAFNLLVGQEALAPIEAGPVKGRIICDIDHVAFMTEWAEWWWRTRSRRRLRSLAGQRQTGN